MKKDIAIGILAFNEEVYLKSVLEDIIPLNKTVFIVNDNSTDNTKDILSGFENHKNVYIVNNKKNLGAGESTKILLEKAKEQNFDFLIKVDGDGQFSLSDIEKIIDLYSNKDYEFIKSNRFWTRGIVGKIPKIRFFGNLLATLLMQISTGTSKLYDPLNGLFGISTNILKHLDSKDYPKRYGYPYFITLSAINNNFKTYQINNVVEYKNEKSGLNSLKVFYIILKLTLKFYFKKLNSKKKIGLYQKSALFDIFGLLLLLIAFTTLIYIILIFTSLSYSFISVENLLILLLFSLTSSIYFFIISFKEESKIRESYIKNENSS